MNSKKKIEIADNPIPMKPKSTSEMAEVPSPQDIYSLLLKVAQDLSKVAQDVGDVKTSMEDLSIKVSQIDGRVSALENGTASMSSEISGSYRAGKNLRDDFHKGTVKTMEIDLKIRSKNLRIVGIEESSGEDLVQTVIEVLGSAYKCDHITSTDIDNVYRVGRKLGPKVRQIMVSFMNTRSKEDILRAARIKEAAFFKGNRVSIYPDYPKEVLEIRMSFKGPKDLARSLGVKSFLNRMNLLTLVFPEGVKTTSDPTEAMKWLNALKNAPNAMD